MSEAIIGALCLVALSRLDSPIRAGPGRILPSIFAFGIALLFGVVLVRAVFDSFGYVDDVRGERLVTGALEQVRGTSPLESENIVIIEGASCAARGLDGNLLQELLKKQGFPTVVLQFTVPGGNHLEREWVLKRFLERSGDSFRALARRANVVFLSEVNLYYDSHLIGQFSGNEGSNVVHAYMTPLNAWRSLRFLACEQTPLGVRWATAGAIARHALVNAFNVGGFRRKVPARRLRALSGYRPLDESREGFKFRGVVHPTEAAVGLMRPALANPQFAIGRNEYLRACAESLAGRRAFFAVPSLYEHHVLYVMNARALTGIAPEVPYFEPYEGDLLSRIDGSRFWYDHGHLRVSGAEIYTRWLSESLVASGLLSR